MINFLLGHKDGMFGIWSTGQGLSDFTKQYFSHNSTFHVLIKLILPNIQLVKGNFHNITIFQKTY